MTPDPDALRSALDIIGDLPRMTDDDGGEWVRWSDVRSILTSQGLAALAGSEPAAGLREAALVRALIEVDDAWRWVKEYYPAALTSMPTYLYRTLDRVRSALAAAPTASPTAEGLIQRAHVACGWCDDHHEEGE